MTTSFTYNSYNSPIQFPDTPEARQIADMLSAQKQRRAAAHQSIFKTQASCEPTTEKASPMPSAFNTTQAEHTDLDPRKLFDDASADDGTDKPNVPEFVPIDDPKCSADQMNAAAMDAMLNGSGQVTQQTSVQVYDALISTAFVPSQVADQKKNKAASINSFLSRVKELDKQLIFPTTQHGQPLREAIKCLMSDIKREYKTASHMVFNAQVLMAVLVQTAHSTKIVTQLHRFMFCQNTADLKQVADYCAVGKPAPIKIDHAISVVHLPGFKLLADTPTLWIQLTGALIDYVCFMSNSAIQKAYCESKAHLASLSLAMFDSIQEFADTEERIYNSHCSFAAAAQRATIDHIDRGLMILATLSSDLKKKLSKIAREAKIPENCQTRDWVIEQLEELEEIVDPDFSWFKQVERSATVCRDFQNGKCSYSNCKFSHAIAIQKTNPNQLTPTASLPSSMATTLISPGSARPKEDLSASDVVEISCRSQIAPNCETNFKASPSFWNAIKNDKGESFEVPKSCTTCRRFAN